MRTSNVKLCAAALSLAIAAVASAHEFACEKLAGVVTLDQNGSVPIQPAPWPGGEIIFDAGPSPVFRVDTYPADVAFVSRVTNVLDRTSVSRWTRDTVETLPRLAGLEVGVVARLDPTAAFPPNATFWSAVRIHIEDYAQCLAIATWYAEKDGRPADDRIENRYEIFYDTGYAECRAQVICAPPRRASLSFVTSVSGTGDLSTWPDSGGKIGLAAGDAICQARAKAAGLDATFRAWLSDDNNDAYCRAHGFDGKKGNNCGQATLPTNAGPWVRTDGHPFGAKLIDMTYPRNLVYTTARFDEFGNELPPGDRRYFTGSYTDGVVMADPLTCDGWTSTVGAITGAGVAGDGDESAWGWSVAHDVRCSASARLLCLEVGPGAALGQIAEPGKLAFVTSGEASAPDLATADATCQARAAAAGLPNSDRFKAWLSDATTDARDRLTSDGPWVRIDGIPVARNKADLLDGFLFAPVNVTELGTYLGEGDDYLVRTDTIANGTAGTCRAGLAFAADAGWTEEHDSLYCDVGKFYCFED